MIPEAWTRLRFHDKQSKLWRTRERFVGVAAGRGSGKSEIARRKVVRVLADRKPPGSNPMYFYGLPTYKQARRVAWKPILRLLPKSWIKKINHTDMFIETVFDSTLFVVGLDKPQRLEGDQWDGGVLDESCDQKPGTFGLSVLPALSHKNGWCWRIGVPKRVGIGSVEFKEFCFEKADEFYTWSSEDILTSEQLAWARSNLDAKDYNEQYRAAWETASGAIFHAWGLQNIQPVHYSPNKPLIIGSDFNVDPMAWIIGQVADNKHDLHIIDELWTRNTNTQQQLDILFQRYGTHKAGFDFYGDATASARKTAASESDYIQIRNDKRFNQARVFYPAKNPRLANRFAACNAAFCNAEGVRRVLVNERCTNLIRDLDNRAYSPGTMEPDDYGDVGHISDALGYVIYKLFPLMMKPAGSVGVYIEVGVG